MIDIKFTPEKNGILLNQENTFDVLLKISSEVENSPKKNRAFTFEFIVSD